MNGSGWILMGVLALTSVGISAQGDDFIEVQLRVPEQVELTMGQAAELRTLAIQLVESAGLSEPSTSQVRQRYEAAITGPHVIVTLPEPRSVSTPNGQVRVTGIVVGLGSPGSPRGIFTLDSESLLRSCEKFSGAVLFKLLALVDSIQSGEGWGKAI